MSTAIDPQTQAKLDALETAAGKPSRRQRKQEEYDRRARLREAERRIEAAELELKVRQVKIAENRLNQKRYQQQGIAVEAGFLDNYVNEVDYLPNELKGLDTARAGVFGNTVRTELEDRKDGDDHPYFDKELDYQESRGIGRYLCNLDLVGCNVMRQLTNYVVSTGFTHTVKINKGFEETAPVDLLIELQAVLNEFLTLNDIVGSIDKELFRRSRRDGEWFIRFHPRQDGTTVLRILEPDQISEPGYSPPSADWFQDQFNFQPGGETTWKYGIHRAKNDVNSVYGYCTRWRYSDWEYVPAAYIDHFKNEVDHNVARGKSDFAIAWDWLKLVSTGNRNMGMGSADRSRISHVTQYETADESDVRNMLANQGMQASDVQKYGNHFIEVMKAGGQKLHLPSGQTILVPDWGDGYEGFINVNKHLTRMVGSIWSMSEGQVTGDDSNNNRASAVEAGSRFWKYAECSQGTMAKRLERIDWRALEFAWRANRFQRWNIDLWTLRKMFSVEVVGQPIEVRDPMITAQTNQIYLETGVKTIPDVQQELGYEVRKDTDGTGKNKALTDSESSFLDSIIKGVVSSGTPVETARAQIELRIPDIDQEMLGRVLKPLEAVVAEREAMKASGMIGPDGKPVPPQPGAGKPGEGQGEGGKNFAAAAQKQSSRTIRSVLVQLRGGEMTEAQARRLLGDMDVDPKRIDDLVADASDKEADEEELTEAAESAALELTRGLFAVEVVLA